MNKQDLDQKVDYKALAKKFWWVIALVVVVIVAVFTVSTINMIKGTFNEGERMEQKLTALYSNSLGTLSECLDKGRVAAQVSVEEFERLKDVLTEVVGVRYEEGSDVSEVLGGGSAFSAIVEAYPQIDQRSWQNLQVVVVGCRGEFQAAQERIQADASIYEQWRVSEDAFNGWIKEQFPSDELFVITPSGVPLDGRAAFEHITRVVTLEEANKAFESGVLGEQDLFGDD